MIPADRISFDGQHAWLVVGDKKEIADRWVEVGRICNSCDGTGWSDSRHLCHMGCIDGRHTWEIEVATKAGGRFTPRTEYQTLRVSVVPGMVLPISDRLDSSRPESYVARMRSGFFLIDRATDTGTPVTLPSAARPGMWAVQLRWEEA